MRIYGVMTLLADNPAISVRSAAVLPRSSRTTRSDPSGDKDSKLIAKSVDRSGKRIWKTSLPLTELTRLKSVIYRIKNIC